MIVFPQFGITLEKMTHDRRTVEVGNELRQSKTTEYWREINHAIDLNQVPQQEETKDDIPQLVRLPTLQMKRARDHNGNEVFVEASKSTDVNDASGKQASGDANAAGGSKHESRDVRNDADAGGAMREGDRGAEGEPRIGESGVDTSVAEEIEGIVGAERDNADGAVDTIRGDVETTDQDPDQDTQPPPRGTKYNKKTDKAWFASATDEDWDEGLKSKPWSLFSEHDLDDEWNATNELEEHDESSSDSDGTTASNKTILERARGMSATVEEERDGELVEVSESDSTPKIIECTNCGNKITIDPKNESSSSGNTGNTSMASIGSEDEEWK